LNYIQSLVEMRVQELGIPDPAVRLEMQQKWKSHYDEYFEQVDNYIRGLFDEVVAGDENLDRFVYAKLKLSCFELFKSFSADNQQRLLEVVDKLIYADGVVHPNEKKFREELQALLKSETPIDLEDSDLEQVSATPLQVGKQSELHAAEENHPLLEHMERHYSRNPELFQQQLSFDYDLITQTLFAWDDQRDPVWARFHKIWGFYDAADKLASAARVRVNPRAPLRIFYKGRELEADATVARARIGPLDRIDAVEEVQ